MSITNIIINDRYTIMQGVNGISLCQETWMVQKKQHFEMKRTESKNKQNTQTYP